MKQYIFQSKNGGWYIYGTNYKDKSDVSYLNLFFPQGTTPMSNSKKLAIDIQEAKFTSYKKQLGLTIFKYEQLDNIQMPNNDEVSVYNKDTQEIDTTMFGGTKSNSATDMIQPDELPFY